jgi:parallel beta-helix repeat protein
LPGKVVSIVLLVLIMMSTSVSAVRLHLVRADGAGIFYINADGSVSPANAPISSVDNATYTFTSNISGSIVVNRDNITLDGAGCVLQGSGSGTGVTISGRHGVTVRNMSVTGFYEGITLFGSSDDTISGNTVTKNSFGVVLNSSSNWNIVSGNTLESSEYCGISVDYSSNNTFSVNNLTANDEGIELVSSNYNVIVGNNVKSSGFIGVYLGFSSGNSVSGNNVVDNFDGFWFVDASGNVIFHNNIVDNTRQIGHSEGSLNAWDYGYPSGGNYWSDYSGVDLYRGALQNERGSDGIGDTAYLIENDNTVEYDHYPLMHPWSSLPVHDINTGAGYAGIQDAINAPETSGGDTIFVESGTYFENLTVNKPVYIIGESSAKTVIDGRGTVTVVHVTQNNVTITGFTIEKGYGIQSTGYVIQSVGSGVFLDDVSGCEITQDNITANGNGIFGYGDSNIITNNSICGNRLSGIEMGWAGHDVVGNEVSENVIDNDSYFGIQIIYGSNNVIAENNISDQNVGLELYGASSQQNTVYDNVFQSDSLCVYLNGQPDANGPSNNTITENTLQNIQIEPGENNTVYHNNFLGANPVIASFGNNTWDNGYPSGGNYWSTHNGTDSFSGPYQNVTGSDGIIDTPYVIDANNEDHYPLAAPISVLDIGVWNGTSQDVEVESNSTLLATQVDVANRTISLSLTRRESTNGLYRITVPNTIAQNLWQQNYRVLLNGEPWPFRNWTDTTGIYVYLSYSIVFSNLTNYVGDLVVNGSETLLISDCEFNITGRLTISDQAQVTLRNCTFVSNWNENDQPDPTIPGGNYYWRTRHVIVEDQAKLNIIDSNVTLLVLTNLANVYTHAIAAYDTALITMTNSTLSWNGDPLQSENSAVYLFDSARLVLTNSSISTFQHAISPEDFSPDVVKNFVSTDNSSTVSAYESRIDQILVDDFYGGNSTVDVTNCAGDFIVIGGGTPQVSLTNTNIIWVENLGSPKVWLKNCTVTEINDEDRTQKSFFSLTNTTLGTLYGYGEIRLDNSRVKNLSVDYARAVLVVWHLPLFGQVLVPYSWAPYIVPTIILVIAVLVVGTVLAVHIRRRHIKQRLSCSEKSASLSTASFARLRRFLL